MKVRLTKAQRSLLVELKEGPRRMSLRYEPAINLERHLFARRSHEAMGFAQFNITDAGKQWLAENAKK